MEAAARRHGLSAEDVVAERRGLSARERLAVYTGGYVLRLLECMRADFPVLRGFIGDSVFDAFAKAYVITMPPVSHSLYDLGADFPRFLRLTLPVPHTGIKSACRQKLAMGAALGDPALIQYDDFIRAHDGR